jgi:hypothetical protein
MNPKTNSKALEQVQLRLSALKSIDPNLDLGDGLTIGLVTAFLQSIRAEIEAYNTEVAAVETRCRAIRLKEDEIARLSDRIADGIAFRFGRKSDEYKMVSSIRRYSRKRKNKDKDPDKDPVTEVVAS